MRPQPAAPPSITAVIRAELLRGPDAVLDAVPRLSPNYSRPDHLPREIAEFYAGVGRGESRRLVFSSPPRWGKTTLNEHGVAWAMFCRPGLKVIVASCTSFLAEQISRRIRGLLEQLGVHIGREQRSVEMWCAANGSSLRAVGRDTAIVGIGCDLLLVDDLVSSMAAAQSETDRARNEQWIEEALGRLEPGASAVVCMHRWAVDDIIGRLIARGWPSVNLPAVDLTTGISTWLARWTTAEMRVREREVGPLVWEAMYLGTPSPRGGRVYSGLPSFYEPNELVSEVQSRSARIVVGCDPAFTARTSADYSAIVVGVVTSKIEAQEYDAKEFVDPAHRHTRMVRRTRHTTRNMLDVVDVHRLQVEAPVLLARLGSIVREWSRVGNVALGIESVGAAKALGQMLRAADPTLRIFDVKRTVDKLTASIPCSAAWSRGEIRWPSKDVPWRDQAMREVSTFTGTGADAHDDIPDALSIAFSLIGSVEHHERNAKRRRDLASLLPYG